MRIVTVIAAVITATSAHATRMHDLTEYRSLRIPNPRNDRAAKRQRAAAKRRNKAKRG